MAEFRTSSNFAIPQWTLAGAPRNSNNPARSWDVAEIYISFEFQICPSLVYSGLSLGNSTAQRQSKPNLAISTFGRETQDRAWAETLKCCLVWRWAAGFPIAQARIHSGRANLEDCLNVSKSPRTAPGPKILFSFGLALGNWISHSQGTNPLSENTF